MAGVSPLARLFLKHKYYIKRMDVKASENFRYHNIERLNRNRDYYDYASEGVLRRCLPKVLFAGNPILVSFIQLIDVRIIMLLQYVDKLKWFKDVTKK